MNNINHKIDKYEYKLKNASLAKKPYYETKLLHYKKQKGGELVDPNNLQTALNNVFQPVVSNQSENIKKILGDIEINIDLLKRELAQKSDVIKQFYDEYQKMKTQIMTLNISALEKINQLSSIPVQQDDPLRKILDDNLNKTIQ